MAVVNLNIDSFLSKTLIEGEIRKKGIEISTINGSTDFTITSATYVMINDVTKEVAEGPKNASIDEKCIYAYIDTAGLTAKSYTIEFTYEVGNTFGKARVRYRLVPELD